MLYNEDKTWLQELGNSADGAWLVGGTPHGQQHTA